MYSQTPSSKPKVTVSLKAFNAFKMLYKYLKNISDQIHLSGSILAFVNALTDEILAWIAKHYPQIKLIRHCKKKDFSPARNIRVLRLESNLFSLPDNNAIIVADFVTQLVRVSQNLSDMAVWAARLRHRSYKLIGTQSKPSILLNNDPIIYRCKIKVKKTFNI